MTVPFHSEVVVVVASRNRRELLLRTLPRLTSLPERPRVLLVDNASDDGTVAAVGERLPEVEIVALRRNMGGAARTVGVERARTPFVAFADDDSWWASGSLTKAVRLFAAYPRLAVVCARVLVEPGGRLDPVSAQSAHSPVRLSVELPGPAVLGFLACGCVVRSQAFLEAGGFEERFGVGGEEELLAMDLTAAGWALAYVDDVVAHHQPHRSPRAGRNKTQLRNQLLCAWMRRSPSPALRRTAAMASSALRNHDARSALLAALAELPWALRRRKALPAEVERELRKLEQR